MDDKFELLMQCMEAVLGNCTVSEFLTYMRQIDCSGDRVTIKGLKYRDNLYIWELRGFHDSTKCSDLECAFWGGPPTKPAFYHGTLLTLLMDRFLVAGLVKKDVDILDSMQDLVPF